MSTETGEVAANRSVLLSAIIPTRDRPGDLVEAVRSVLAQDRLPDELIIVDQSRGREARDAVESIVASSGTRLSLVYVHDPSIAGLVPAKVEGVRIARGDVVCFLEDDIVLDREYVGAIERGFAENPKMMGCCGVVIRMPSRPSAYLTLFHLFHRGMFRDPRVGIHGDIERLGKKMIPSDYLSGGLSAYRKAVFEDVPFDVGNDFFMLEDVDFSTRAAKRFGSCFYINPCARLEHRISPRNRSVAGARQRRKVREFMVFWRKRRSEPHAIASLLWLLIGLGLAALFESLATLRAGPVSGFISGMADGVRWKLVPTGTGAVTAAARERQART